jgi:L-ascorbate metabolism protein UlaG (beta-lactamase superfamily)
MTDLSKLYAPAGQLAVCWTGNAGWLIGAEGRVIGIDLDLQPGEARRTEPAVSVEDVAPRLSVLFVTHGHGDHMNRFTCEALARKSACTFVLPVNCTGAAREIGVPEERVRVARPGQPFDLPGVHVAPLRAIHGHKDFTVYQGANLEDCGYLLTLGGRRVLHPGDSLLLPEHLESAPLDVLFVSPTEHNTHVERSASLIESLKPEHVFPQHYGTYKTTDANRFWTQGYPEELRARLSGAMQARYHKLEEGAVFVLE